MPLDKFDYFKIVTVVIAVIVTIGVIEYAYGYYIVAPKAIDEAYEAAKTELQNWWHKEGIKSGVDIYQYYDMQNDLADVYGKPHPYQPTPAPTLPDHMRELLDPNRVRVTDFTYQRNLTKYGEGVIDGSITITYIGEQDIANLTLSIDDGTAYHYNGLAQGWQQTFKVNYKLIPSPALNPNYAPDSTVNIHVNGQRVGSVLLTWYDTDTHIELDDSYPSSIFKLSVSTTLAYNNTYVVIVDIEEYSAWATSQSPWHLDFTIGDYIIPLNSQENVRPIVYACNIVRTEDTNLLVLHGNGKNVTLPLYWDNGENREYTVEV